MRALDKIFPLFSSECFAVEPRNFRHVFSSVLLVVDNNIHSGAPKNCTLASQRVNCCVVLPKASTLKDPPSFPPYTLCYTGLKFSLFNLIFSPITCFFLLTYFQPMKSACRLCVRGPLFPRPKCNTRGRFSARGRPVPTKRCIFQWGGFRLRKQFRPLSATRNISRKSHDCNYSREQFDSVS